MLRYVRPSVCLSVCLCPQLNNDAFKTKQEVELVSRQVHAEASTKPWSAPLHKHSLGGHTISTPRKPGQTAVNENVSR